MRWRPVTAAVAAAAVAALVTSCGTVPPGTATPWREVPLPGDARPSSLAADDGRLLVGGSSPGTGGPVLLSLDPAGNATSLDLRPVQGYARTADLVDLSPAGGALVALGVARGGAHGNQRWTVWEGPLDGAIGDVPQGFSTFGGHEAGPLLGVVRPSGTPVIVGSRGGEDGFYAALWTATGATWTRRPTTDPQLRSGPDRVLSFRAATAAGDTILIAGAEIGLAGTVRQAPVLWLGGLDGPWRTVHLPIPAELGAATGLAQASAVACGQDGVASCWVAGWVRGRPVAWEVDPAAATARETVLPGTGGTGTDPTLALAVLGAVPVVLTNAEDAPVLAWRCGGDWRTAPAPPGQAAAAVGIGSRVYAVVGEGADARLWEAEPDTRGC